MSARLLIVLPCLNLMYCTVFVLQVYVGYCSLCYTIILLCFALPFTRECFARCCSIHVHRLMFSKSGDRNHQRPQYTLQGLELKLFNCRKCRFSLIGSGDECVCCRKNHPITFRRRLWDNSLEYLYKLRTFLKYSIHMNSTFYMSDLR